MTPAEPSPARPEIEIIHDVQAQRFVAVVDGRECECAYLLADGVARLVHTEVPRALEGRGIAAALVRQALEWARAEGLKVRPVCGYVASYMRRHPQTQDLLAR
jgi:hypothetical protein